jgi:L-2-hydroxyglutarate oxidase LhgO
MADAAVTVIGAGVVGLATAAELAAHFAPVLLLERYPKVGQETSSRNSEVIHAGLYYPHGSLKAELCIEGRHLLYELAERHGIPHRRVTKIITAASPGELEALERLYHHGRNNGVELELITAGAAHALEPHIASAGAIVSPTTGIISAHGLMDYFHHAALERGAVVQTRCEVTGIARVSGGYAVMIREGGEESTFTTERLVNAAGLESDTIAALAGIDVDAADYRLHWCKGSYFALNGALRHLVQRLVYPVPPKESLGVHALMDLAGRVRFGPDVEYLPGRTLAYAVDEEKRPAFAASVRHILPMVKDDDLTPDMSGIRPKLQRKGEPVRDYIIAEESGRGLPGFINLIGIESPGLTASPAIARRVLSLCRSL